MFIAVNTSFLPEGSIQPKVDKNVNDLKWPFNFKVNETEETEMQFGVANRRKLGG